MRHLTVLTLLVTFLLSCVKERRTYYRDIIIDPIPQFSVSVAKFTPSSKLLKQEVSYTQLNPLLKNVKLFSYDDALRCTDIRLGTIDSSKNNPVFTLKQILTFNYDGSSILPSSFSSVKTVFPNLTTTFFFKYNSQGRKIMDSVRVKNQAGNPADRVIHYKYYKDEVYITPVFAGFPMENNSLDTLSLLTDGNIKKLVSRIIKSTGDQIENYTFTYDESISPYNKLNIANSLYFESASLGIGYNVPNETHYMGVTANNMTSYTAGTHIVTFKYLYDQDNYPVKKEIFLPKSSHPYQVILFEY